MNTKDREIIHIPKYAIPYIINKFDIDYYEETDEDGHNVGISLQDLKTICNQYKLIKTQIKRVDDDDGGGHYNVVIQRLSDNKYFSLNYCDWDLEYNFSIFPERFVEVFPEKVTTTIYK